jgi:D-alanyl-D-alanine carboxypeptidase
MTGTTRRTLLTGLAGSPAAIWLASACTSSTESAGPRESARGRVGESEDFGVARPGALNGALLSADVLITSHRMISRALREELHSLEGVFALMPLGLSSASFSGRTLSIAAVDPEQFRRFTPLGSAQTDAVWARVADGEAALDPAVGRRVEQPAGYLTLGQGQDSPTVHVGAYAPLVKRIQAVVDLPRGAHMGIPNANALLLSTGELTPSAVTGRIKRVLNGGATIQVLAREFDLSATETAVLTGGSVSDAVGSFTYVSNRDGTITPDSSWVERHIRTQEVPIVGSVTGNTVMFPQLRSALGEVVARGLTAALHPSQYGGCYVPRYIGHDPRLGLSLHSWGIAVDLNVAENQRGTHGHMNPQIVEIFKKWGFDWGGDWHYTDPMHFEMSSLVHAG